MAARQPAPLALDYAAHGASTGWRKDEHLIDALPYVDHVSAELRAQVEALVEEEKKHGVKQPSDYLRDLGPIAGPSFEGHPVLKAEYERVRAKLPMQALDNTRYRLDPPPQTKRGDLGAWKAALDNANSQLEHQYLRILNQELLLKHGDKVWRAQGQLDDALVKGLEAQLAATKKETDALNRERKLQQMAAGSELSKLEAAYLAQVRKNFVIEAACLDMDEEVASLEEQLQQEIQRDTQLQAGPGQEGPVAVAVVANGDAEQPGSNGHHDGGDAAMDEAT